MERKIIQWGNDFNNEFAISVEINSKMSDDSWILTNVYGPCTPEGKQNFTDWLRQIQMPEDREWIVLGDFNLIRKPEDRNRGEGNMAEMFMFNDTISHLGINEITL